MIFVLIYGFADYANLLISTKKNHIKILFSIWNQWDITGMILVFKRTKCYIWCLVSSSNYSKLDCWLHNVIKFRCLLNRFCCCFFLYNFTSLLWRKKLKRYNKLSFHNKHLNLLNCLIHRLFFLNVKMWCIRW